LPLADGPTDTVEWCVIVQLRRIVMLAVVQASTTSLEMRGRRRDYGERPVAIDTGEAVMGLFK